MDGRYIFLFETFKTVLSFCSGLYLRWDVTLAVLSTLAPLIALAHALGLVFNKKWYLVEQKWMAFLQLRAFEWVKYRPVLQYYSRWNGTQRVGADVVAC